MQNVTSAFKRALAEDRRDYLLKAVITLADGTVLSESITTELPDGTEEVDTHAWLSNYSIWQNGFAVDDAVSADNVFQVGAAIINKATLILNNIYEDFDAYDFKDATVVLSVGLADLDNNTTEYVKKGIFIVDDPTYNGSLITLSCLDYMAKFDKPYVTTLTGPVTLGAIVGDMCTRVGVSLASNSSNFPHKDYLVEELPSGESTTYRQVLSWAAQIAGCFARINVDGELELKWYDRTTLEAQASDLDGGTFDDGTPYYSSGDTADGGSFNPWDTGAEIDGGGFTDVRPIHYITSSFSHNVSTDDVVITGVKVVKKVKTEGSSDAFYEYTSGTTGYMVVIENNDLIQGANGQNIANWLGTQLIGFTFRKADITHLSDPTIEAGDVALYWDRKGNVYSIVVSSTRFAAGSSQQTSSSAETPRKNSAAQFTEATRNYVEMRKQMQAQKDAVEDAMDDLADRIANADGLYKTYTVNKKTGSGLIYHYHNKPDLAESDIVMIFSTAGFTLTANYQDAQPNWYGITVDGQFVADTLNAYGINANWIRAGAIEIKDSNGHTTFYADTESGTVTIDASTLSISGSAVSEVARQEAQSVLGNVGETWYGNEVPTANNYPASSWTTTDDKIEHENDMYIDKVGGGIYQYHKANGLRIKFSDGCVIDDYNPRLGIYFYMSEEDKWYLLKDINPLTTADIAGKEFFIPTNEYAILFQRSGVAAAATTWSIESETPASGEFPSGATWTTLPDYWSDEAVISCSGMPTYPYPGYSITSYSRWLLKRAASTINDYVWEKVNITTDVKQNLSQEDIFNKLTNNGTVQGLFLDGNNLYMHFEFAQGGTLKLGGANNGNGVLEVRDSSGTQNVILNNNGFTSYTGSKKTVVNNGEFAVYNGGTYCGSLEVYISSISGEYSGAHLYSPYSIRLTVGQTIQSQIALEGNQILITDAALIAQDIKARMVSDTVYGNRLLYCYETPTPYFGDIGTGQTDENGEAVIAIDDIFDETVNTNIEYCVFLQKEGQGDLWVDEKDHSYFIVKGTPNLKFSWEVKAVQKGFENLRLDDNDLRRDGTVPVDEIDQLLDEDLAEYDKEMEELYQ